nr:MAG TPA: hypothetical protein [Caudoviricetes sp.]
MLLARFTVYTHLTIYTRFTVHNRALYTVDRVPIMCYNADSGKGPSILWTPPHTQKRREQINGGIRRKEKGKCKMG